MVTDVILEVRGGVVYGWERFDSGHRERIVGGGWSKVLACCDFRPSVPIRVRPAGWHWWLSCATDRLWAIGQ